MEGEGSKSLPEEKASKGSSTKLIAAIVVVVLIVAAIGGALILMGGTTAEKKGPTAVFSISSSNIAAGDSTVFDASKSNDSDGKIIEYVWNFGDGNMQVTSGASVRHFYFFPGAYIVNVMARDDNHKTSTSDVGRVVVDPVGTAKSNESAPTAVIATSADTISNVIKINDTVAFDGNTSWAWTYNSTSNAFEVDNTAIDNYTWWIGGAVQKFGVKFNYKFASAGLFAVQLQVTGTNGLTAMSIMTVQVKATGGTPVPRSDIFVFASTGEPQTIDPAWDYESAGGEVLNQIYEGLVYYNGTSIIDLKPVLATVVPTVENGGITLDGLNYTFHLRQNVKFHDGNVMTADDVVYSFKRVLIMNDVEGAAWMLGQVLIPNYKGLGKAVSASAVDAAITKVNATTVKFTLQFPYAAFMYIMAYSVCSIVEKNYVEAHGSYKSLTKNTFMNRNEMGTGPFKLKEWAPNQYVMLQRFDDYWGTKAILKYVLIKKVMDLGTREMLLFKGDADAIYVPVAYKNDVQGKSGVRTALDPMLGVNAYSFNWNISSGLTSQDNVPKTFFADVNVRKAFVAAFDTDKYIKDGTLFTAQRVNGPIPSPMFGFNASFPFQQFNLTQAAAYLKLAVDTRTGAAPGSTYADNGFHITLYYNAGNLGRQIACEIMKSGLEMLSINHTYDVNGSIVVDIRALDWPTYLDVRAAKQMPIYFLGWNVDYADPDDFVNPYLHQNGSYPSLLGWTNNTLTHLIEDAAKEVNTTARLHLYEQIYQSAYDNAYHLWVSQPKNFIVERTYVQGHIYNPMQSEDPGLYVTIYKLQT